MRSLVGILAVMIVVPAGCRHADESPQRPPADVAPVAPTLREASARDSTAGLEPTGVLLAANVSGTGRAFGAGVAYVEAIALMHDSTFIEPPVGEVGDSLADAFRGHWFVDSLQYRLFTNGAEVGTLDSLQAEEHVCAYLDARGKWRPAPDQTPGPFGIATNLPIAPSPSRWRSADAPDSLRLASYARRLLADSGLRLPTATALAQQSVVSVDLEPRGARALVGTFRATQPAPLRATGDEAEVLSLVVIAEPDSSGLGPTVLLFGRGAGEGLHTWRFYDALDVRGDHTPEIILEERGYEGHSYSIYQRTQAGWRLVYQGGGGGC